MNHIFQFYNTYTHLILKLEYYFYSDNTNDNLVINSNIIIHFDHKT